LQLFEYIFTDRFQKILTRADNNSNILVLLSCGALLRTEESKNYLQVFANERYVFKKHLHTLNPKNIPEISSGKSSASHKSTSNRFLVADS